MQPVAVLGALLAAQGPVAALKIPYTPCGEPCVSDGFAAGGVPGEWVGTICPAKYAQQLRPPPPRNRTVALAERRRCAMDAPASQSARACASQAPSCPSLTVRAKRAAQAAVLLGVATFARASA